MDSAHFIANFYNTRVPLTTHHLPTSLPVLSAPSPTPIPQEYDKAIETYQAGLKHDPENQELKEGLMRCVAAINKVIIGPTMAGVEGGQWCDKGRRAGGTGQAAGMWLGSWECGHTTVDKELWVIS